MRLNQVMILQHPFYALLFCHNDSAIIRNADHVFYLSRKSVIFGINRPVIVFINKEFRTAFVDHWFDGKDHTRNQKHFASLWCNIAYPRFFVEFKTNTMSADFLYNRIAICFCM